MKKILFIIPLLFLSSIVSATDNENYRDISCENVLSTLSWNNSMSWEEFDINWVRYSYWTDLNKWEKYDNFTEWLSIDATCMYSWRITKVTSSIIYQYLLYNRNWDWVYFVKRPVTKSLINEENLKNKNSAYTGVLNSNLTVPLNLTTTQNNFSDQYQDYLKSIEDAKMAIEQKKIALSSVESINTIESPIKILSLKNQKKAKLLKNRIAILKKQIEQLQKQIDTLN